MTISADTLRKVVPNLPMDRAVAMVAIIAELCPKYKVDTADVFHEFISNVAHESGGFRIRKESLNYTRPERLVQVWPSRFTLTGESNKRDARLWVNKPVELANLVYGGRMGNIQTGDGSKFVGGGFAQITGRDAYTLYTRFVINRDGSRKTIDELANLVQTEDHWAFDSAFWFFCEFKNLEAYSIQDNFKEVVRRWNGGFVGMAERQQYYERAKKFIS